MFNFEEPESLFVEDHLGNRIFEGDFLVAKSDANFMALVDRICKNSKGYLYLDIRIKHKQGLEKDKYVISAYGLKTSSWMKHRKHMILGG